MPPAHTGGSHTPGVGGVVSRVGQRLQALGTVESALWVVVTLALVLDVYLTYQGLRHGFAEWNPVMRSAIDAVGITALGLAKVLAVGIAGVCRTLLPEYGSAIALGLAVPWLVAIAVNTVQLAPILLA